MRHLHSDNTIKQRTICAPVHAIGIGVHSSRKVRMTLRPAGENTGIRFVRTDLPGSPEVRACAQHVSDTTLSTSLSSGDVQIATVEHLMSALWGLGIDNLIVELNAEEVPIMDGSAAPFIYLIRTVGVQEQTAAKQFVRIKREIKVSQGDSEATLLPYMGFKASYQFEADHPVYNRYPKRVGLDFSSTSFADEVSRARSFGLAKELEQAQAINRCLGSSLTNAVGIDDYDVINEEGLRYNDEFVKHKLLDAIGDLYLLGRPVLGEFVGQKSGHALNNKLARAIYRCEDAWEIVTVGADETEATVEPLAMPAIV
ncbi:MAG: UDP-3-O-acyl-N-acetylglucosamine deacetylase [Pseudomonadaceae bacterium]|nr:UDP-3-O-acyl-N-acetylglucosamine deacetylase [Pseudomonadaceae bacterium]